MSKTLKNLVLALLNATLILIALCLFLGLKVVNRANDITDTFASNLIKLEPLKDEVAAARAELAGLRSDLADLKAAPGDLREETLTRIETRMDRVTARLDTMQVTMQEVRTLPYDLTDHAIQTAADEFGAVISTPLGARAAE